MTDRYSLLDKRKPGVVYLHGVGCLPSKCSSVR